MGLREIFKLQSGTFKVLGVVILITAGIVLYAYTYYTGINRSIDPRVIEARKAFRTFDKLKKQGRYDEALKTLDKIDKIYHRVPGYAASFETGVVAVNKGSVYLIRVENEHLNEVKTLPEKNLELYLKYADEYTLKGIDLYQKWMETTGKKSEKEILESLGSNFKKDDPVFKGYDFEEILNKRTEEIIEAQVEASRRLSVAFTNMGVISRYKHDNQASKSYYEKALKLWPENHVAANNLRVLHGKEIKKRTVVEQLFPKERIEKARENMKK